MVFSEHSVEGSQVVKPAVEGDFGHRSVPIPQTHAGQGETIEHEKIQKGRSCSLFDAMGKIIFGIAAMPGNFIQRNGVGVMLGDVFVDLSQQ